jgi:hypothetical protein
MPCLRPVYPQGFAFALKRIDRGAGFGLDIVPFGPDLIPNHEAVDSRLARPEPVVGLLVTCKASQSEARTPTQKGLEVAKERTLRALVANESN